MKRKLSREEVAAKWLRKVSFVTFNVGRNILHAESERMAGGMLREIDAAKPKRRK